jgi:hypothetical protein
MLWLGAGVATEKSATINGSDVPDPPPGPGLFTVIVSVPLFVKSVAGKTAVTDVALT